MLKKVTAFALTLTLMSFMGACSDDDGGAYGDAIDKLRSCGLLTEGTVNSPDDDEPEAECFLKCYTKASCDDLEIAMCTDTPPQSMQLCLAQCQNVAGDFECADGSDTISQEWVCDCIDDCDDGSDEANCPADTCFECADGSDTVSKHSVCDCSDDCTDGSDEANCPANNCFQCADNSFSIPMDWKCDCYADCQDLSDEVGCPAGVCFECEDGGFSVPSEYVCDLYPDCNDGSDEQQGCATVICPE